MDTNENIENENIELGENTGIDLETLYHDFHKRFVEGEQDLYIEDNKIIKSIVPYWCSANIYNHTGRIIENLYFHYKLEISEEQLDHYLFSQFGLVSKLIPIQRAYNVLMNKISENSSRLVLGNLCVEDGSVDLDDLEETGLVPGKTLVYRQGARIPSMLYSTNDLDNALKILNQERQLLLDEFNLFMESAKKSLDCLIQKQEKLL